MIYLELLLVTFIVIYIVDLSGFTTSWRRILARLLHRGTLPSLKPFDCSQCMTWWCTLVWSWLGGAISLRIVAFCALLAFLSYPMGQVLIFVKELALKAISKLMAVCRI